jgi:hypothetical protein
MDTLEDFRLLLEAWEQELIDAGILTKNDEI